MKTTHVKLLFLLICLLFSVGALKAQQMDPALYLETSKAVVSLPRAMALYNHYIELMDPELYGIFDVDITTNPSRLLSVDGELGGYFIGVDGFFYWRFLTIGDFSIKALLLPSIFFFSMDAETSQAMKSVYGDSKMDWISGYAFCGLQAYLKSDRLTLGAILRMEPRINPGPPALFTRIPNGDGDQASTEQTFFDRFYADFSFSGWRLDALLSPEFIEHTALEKLFKLAGQALQIGPIVEYLGRISSFRPGISTYWQPVPWFEVTASARVGISPQSFGLGEASLDMHMPFILIRNIDKTGKDMTLNLEIRSAVGDFGAGLIPGFKVEASLRNYPFITWFDLLGLRYLGTNTLGISWNYAETLERMPFPNQFIIYLRMGGMYYRPANF